MADGRWQMAKRNRFTAKCLRSRLSPRWGVIFSCYGSPNKSLPSSAKRVAKLLYCKGTQTEAEPMSGQLEIGAKSAPFGNYQLEIYNAGLAGEVNLQLIIAKRRTLRTD